MTCRSLVRTLGETIALPLVAFALLTIAGAPQLWALLGSAVTSVLVVGGRYRRTGTISTLSLIVLARFAAGAIVAMVTGSATLTLAKDPAFTGVVALAALGTLAVELPLTARIRRELSGDPAGFEDVWRSRADYRRTHRKLTVMWGIGLLLESATGFAVVYALDFATAVVITRLLSPMTLIVLSAWTTYADAMSLRRRPILRARRSSGTAPMPPAEETVGKAH